MILIIDMDVVCYGACKKRAEPINGKDFTDIDGDVEGDEDLQDLYTQEEDDEYLEECKNNLLGIVDQLREETYATEVIGYVKGTSNFRDRIYDKYKSNRKKDPSKRNKFVPLLRDWCVEQGIAHYARDCEADDEIRIKVEECRAAKKPYIVASVDKDLIMIPGKHYRMHAKIMGKRAGNSVCGIINVTEDEAMRFFYKQLIIGDGTDFIKGVPGYGPVAANDIIGICETEEEMQHQVMHSYWEVFGVDWKDQLMLNGNMIYLLKTIDDRFNYHLENWPPVSWK